MLAGYVRIRSVLIVVEPCETKAKTSKLNTAAHVPRYQFSDSHFFLFVKLRQSNNSYSKE